MPVVLNNFISLFSIANFMYTLKKVHDSISEEAHT